MSSEGKVAIITGAGSGIGKATALAFLNDGYKVALAGRRSDALENTVKEAGDKASYAITLPTDISAPVAVKNLFKKTSDAFGRIDVVFNNAGQFSPAALLEDLTFEQWKLVIDVNLTGTFLCIQEAFRYMKSQNHRVDASSTTARFQPTFRGLIPYPIPQPNTPLPDLPEPPRLTGASITSPAVKLMSEMQRQKGQCLPDKDRSLTAR